VADERGGKYPVGHEVIDDGGHSGVSITARRRGRSAGNFRQLQATAARALPRQRRASAASAASNHGC